MCKTRIKSLLKYILNAPLLTLVLLGFSTSYIFFFVFPIFLSAQVMQNFKSAPSLDYIGGDLRLMLSYSESWFISKQTPYIGYNLYPPLASVLFTPFLIVGFSLAYKIVTIVNVFCYFLITLVFPFLIGKERQVSPLLILVFITGLFSYGFQFELERGQFNVIAMSICFLAIWIFYYRNWYRYFAYFLFAISVQLKVFPLIFIVMFVSDWSEWKKNIKRLFFLAAVNFALLFVLGPCIFVDFMKAIITQIVNPHIWKGNHSIRSFVTQVSNLASEHGLTWANQYTVLAQIALLVIFAIIMQAYRQKQNGINSPLLLSCTIGALLIPSVSHDYKLSILAAPVAIFLSNVYFPLSKKNSSRERIIFITLIFILSAAYFTTIFSFTNKPLVLWNNFPALFAMLFVTVISSILTRDLKENCINKDGHL